MPLQTREPAPADEDLISPSRVDPATWERTSQALIGQLQDPHDPTALRRRIAETHDDALADVTESRTNPTAVEAADLYGRLTEI